MYVKINKRNQIVEAQNDEKMSSMYIDPDYIKIEGTVEDLIPEGVDGFNGRVYCPNYMIDEDLNVLKRTEEDMARDPYSDIEPTIDDVVKAQTNIEKSIIDIYEMLV